MNDAQRTIRALIVAGIPVVTTGPPGVGKTGWFRALVNEHGFEVQDLRAAMKITEPGAGKWAMIQVVSSIRDPEDIAGWPVRTDDGLIMDPAIWAKAANHLANLGYFVLVMFDELRTISAAKQAAIMKPVHERLVGDEFLNPEIRFIAAANDIELSANGVPLEAAFANRWAHVDWELDAKSWAQGMYSGKFALQSPLPKKYRDQLGQERALIASFIERRPELLLQVPKDEEGRDGAWPSPRMWDTAAHALSVSKDSDLRARLVASCVGLAQAAEFIEWQNSLDLPDPEDIISGAYKGAIHDPMRGDKTFAILSSVVAALTSNKNATREKAVWNIFKKIADEGAPDIAAGHVATMFDLASTPPPKEVSLAFRSLLQKSGYLP